MGQQSSFEGADAAANGETDAGMDASRFWDVLRDTLGVDIPKAAKAAQQEGADAMSESSDSEGFYASGASGSGSSDEDVMQADNRGTGNGAAGVSGSARDGGEGWEAATATDSDDDASEVNDDEFMAEYDRAMSEQLRGTHMAETFDKLGGDAPSAQQTGGVGEQVMPADDEAIRPVDVDLNLVSSLLESVASQQGMPGPATNLAAMLGLKLPGGESGR